MPDTTHSTDQDGKTVFKFDAMAANVVPMGHTQEGPHVMVGLMMSPPFGPCVVMGAGARIPGDPDGIALVAHLHPDAAIELASRLMLAASTVLEAQGKGGRA